MKRFFWLLTIIVLVQCEKQNTEPEIEYHTVEYIVDSSGDTLHIIYKDQDGELQDVTIAYDGFLESWSHEFEAEKGTNLFISATNWGGGKFVGSLYNLVYASVYIFIDGELVAKDVASAFENECICLKPEPLTDFEGWCQCHASTTFAGILW